MPYVRPYPNGYKDFPDKTTPVTAAILNAQDDALEKVSAKLDYPGAFRTFGGSIRNMGAANGYWQPIDDAAHWPWGIASVTTTTVGIEIAYNFTASGIGTVIAVPDETLAADGWSMGASVEKDKCTLKLGRQKTIGDHVTWDGTKWTSSAGVYTATWSTANGGMLVLKHTRMFGQAMSISPRGYGVAAVNSTSGPSDPATETRLELYHRETGARIATTAEIPANSRVTVSRTDSVAGGGSINPQSAPDQIELPNSNIWLYGVHYLGPRPTV